MDLALLALLACGDAPAPAAPEPEPAALEPSPWVFETSASGEPPVDLDRLARALDEALVEVLTYDAQPVVDGYLGYHARSAEPTCPPETVDGYGNAYWADLCYASDGTYFGGYLSRYDFGGTYDAASGLWLDGVVLSGNIAVTDAAGTYDLEGYAASITGESTDGSVRLLQSYLIGGFAHDAPTATGWLADAGSGAAVDVSLIAYAIPSIGGAAVAVDAAVQVEVDEEPYSVVFDVELGNEPIGSLCAEEPGGAASIRDPYGRWFDLAFHGPDLTWLTTLGDPTRCEGCADVTLDGSPVGEVCASFDAWYQWEEVR